MSEEPLDALVALYRKTARETPSTRADGRILRHAERASRRRLIPHPWAWPWLGAAIAAGLLLWLGNQRLTAVPPPAPAVDEAAAGKAPPGYGEDKTRDYLLRMDIVPPPSPVAQYLLTQNPPSH